MDKTEIQARLEFWKKALTKLREAYFALVDGGAKSYTIDDRQLTRFDIDKLKTEIEEAEKNVDKYSAMLLNKKPRRAFGVVPLN